MIDAIITIIETWQSDFISMDSAVRGRPATSIQVLTMGATPRPIRPERSNSVFHPFRQNGIEKGAAVGTEIIRLIFKVQA